MKKKLIAFFVTILAAAIGTFSVMIAIRIKEERAEQKEEETLLYCLSMINHERYYAKTSDSKFGEFYWIYDFEWDSKNEEGSFKRSAYYADQTPVYVSVDKYLDRAELRQYGGFNIEYGNWTTVWDVDGYTLNGGILSGSSKSSEKYEFTFDVIDNCVYVTDSRGYKLLPGSPWDKLPADYAEPILLCKQTERENWFFWTESEAGASADMFFSNEDNPSEVIMDIDDPGDNLWSVQAKYENITLEKGHKYRVSFDYMANALTRAQQKYTISNHHGEFAFLQNYDPYEPYYKEKLELQTKYNEYYQHVETTFIMTHDTDTNVFCGFSFGGLGDVGALVKIANFKLEKIS